MAVLNKLQNGTVVLPVNTLSVTVTLANSVVMSQAFLVFSCSFNSASPSTGNVAGELTTPTLLTFSRGDLVGAPAITIKWYVAEFISGISVQRGSLLLNTVTSANIPLSAVHLSSAFPLITATADDIVYSQDDFIRADIINATTLQITVDGGTPGSTIKWQVIEFTDCIVQHGNIAWGATDLSQSVSITPVVTNRAWLVFSYLSASGTGANISQKMVRGRIASTSQIVFDRDNSGQTMTLSWYLIEFTDNTTVQHGSTQLGTGELVKDTVISRINRNQSIVTAGGIGYQGGKTNYIATDNPGVASATLDLTSSINLQMTRGFVGPATADIAWFVIDFTDTSEIPPAQPQRTLCTPDPILRFTDGDKIVDILAPGSGWQLDNNFKLQLAQYKGGGSKVDPSIAPGQRLVHKEYDNVIETIPLVAKGFDQNACIATINELLSLAGQSANYWAESFELDDVWMEIKPAQNDARVGYAKITQMRIAELSSPFEQPFFSPYKEAIMDGLTLIVEREPLWRLVPPGELIGPLYNLIRNPDFELWNNGIVDSQPDNWTDLETIQITGDNSQQSTAVHSGNYALKVHVGGSTLTGRIKGVTQVINGTRSNTTYTVVAWVRSEGVSNGVGRILVTYSGQLEVYRDSVRHGWTLYTGTFTTADSSGEVVAINCEILTTAADTDGTVYFDSLMLLEGDWEQEAIDGILPYLSSSHIVNHWDQPSGIVEAGDINYVDVWDVPGTEDALIRLDLKNNTTPADENNPVERFSTIRIGMRRTGDVFSFDNFFDPPGAVDTTASGDNRLTSGLLSSVFQTLATKVISDASLIENTQGRFRVFGRFYDSTGAGAAFQIRLNYFVGTPNVAQKTLRTVTAGLRLNWFIASLTPNAAMVWDLKFAGIPPGALGYSVDVSRPGGSGTPAVYLDYVMALPTDGGYVEVELNSPLPYQSALTIDGTTAAGAVGSVQDNLGGWRTDWQGSANDVFYWLQEFNGNLYSGGWDQAGQAQVFRREAGSFGWTEINKPTARRALCAETYNGKLYIGSETTLNTVGAIFSSTDGQTWTTESSGTHRPVNGLVAFGGYLYASCGGIGAGVAGSVLRYDGSTWTVILNPAGIQYGDITAFDNQVYTCDRNGTRIYTLNPTTGVWTTTTLSTSEVFKRFGSFAGQLYIGQGITGNYYSFDGSTWTLRNFTGNVVIPTALKFIEFNSRLYMVLHSAVYVSDNGIDWDLSTPSFDSTTPTISDLFIYQNELYFVADYAATIRANGQVISSFSPPASFAGTPFAAPPQKRHRYFFLYDRAGGINGLDDAALIGIGFVPRSRGLIGKG